MTRARARHREDSSSSREEARRHYNQPYTVGLFITTEAVRHVMTTLSCYLYHSERRQNIPSSPLQHHSKQHCTSAEHTAKFETLGSLSSSANAAAEQQINQRFAVLFPPRKSILTSLVSQSYLVHVFLLFIIYMLSVFFVVGRPGQQSGGESNVPAPLLLHTLPSERRKERKVQTGPTK